MTHVETYAERLNREHLERAVNNYRSDIRSRVESETAKRNQSSVMGATMEYMDCFRKACDLEGVKLSSVDDATGPVGCWLVKISW